MHFLVEFFSCDTGSLNSMPFWKTVLIQTAEGAGLKVLNQHFFQFTPDGITGYLLLSTSHISIHTWPEHGYAACDVFSCGGDEETQEAVDSIIAKLPHQRVNLKRIIRGYRWLGYDAEGSVDFFETTREGAPPVRIPVQRLVYKERSAHQEIVICDTEIFGRCLLLDGDIQCSERDHELYDRTMLHRLASADCRLLIIGGGDGYIVATAMHLSPSLAEITVVDLDGEVANACSFHLHQNIFDHAGVNLVVQDALQFMEQHEKGAYDGIICDLTASPVGYRRSGELRGFYRRVFDLVLILRAIQIAGLISIFFRSRAWHSVMHGVQIILNIIAHVHPWFATIVSGVLWFVSCVKIALSHFYAIDDEDGVDDAVVKVRNLHLMSLFYDIVDYWAAAYCALLVSYMAAYQWSFVAKTIWVWLLVDIPFAMGALYGCFATGKDLTWGEAHRRAHDGVYTHNRIAGWIYRIVQHVVGIIWDGPEQLAIFYSSELMTRSRMYAVALFLSTFQAIFWAWAYSLANDAFIIRALEWLD